MSIFGLDDRERPFGGERSTIDPPTAEELQLQNKANSVLALSAISILFCCLGGIIATYFAYKAKQDADAYDVLGANHNLNVAIGWMIATFVIGILGIIGKLSQR